MNPTIDKNAFIAPNATVVGDVEIKENASVWYGAVLRGDSGKITLGENSNVQDNCVIHENTLIGKNCTVGHGAILHGCTLKDNCLVGMGAIVLDGAVREESCMVGAGSVVTGKTAAPAGSLLLGSPAKVIKPLTDAQREYIRADAENYVKLAKKAFPAFKWTMDHG